VSDNSYCSAETAVFESVLSCFSHYCDAERFHDLLWSHRLRFEFRV